MLSAARPGAPLARLGAALLLAVAAAAPFVGLLDVHFLKDDLNLKQFADEAGRPSWDAFVRWFLWPKGAYAHDQFYRPLPMLLGYCEFSLAGPDPRVMRASNVVFHALNAVLLAAVLDRLTGRRRPYAALFAGLLFALHPAHGEAVVWIAQRMVVHQLFWTLVALLGLDAWLSRRSRGGLAVVAVASLAAALTKETAAALPAVFGLFACAHPSTSGGFVAAAVRGTKVAAAALPVPALVLGLRYALFGTVSGSYGGVPVAEYAARHRTFERLPESLGNGLLGANPYEAPQPFRVALGAILVAAAAAGLWAACRGLRDGRVRAAFVFGLGFAAVSLAPMLPIFYCEPWLAGARFLYQPIAGLAVAAVAGAFRAVEAPRRPPTLAPAAAVVVAAAVAGAVGLSAYRGADRQIRAVRDGALREAAARPDAAFVLHRTPAEFHGVPTIDLYAGLLVAPPLAPVRRELFAIVAGGERTFDAAGFAAWRDGPARGRPLVHLRVVDDPLGVGALFGPARAAAGDAPALFAPEDGACVACPDLRGVAPDGAAALAAPTAPALVFAPVAGAATYRLSLVLAEASSPPTTPRALTLNLDPARHLERDGDRLRYRFARGAVELPPGGPDAWTHLATNGFEPPPLFVAWSLEAVDAAGRTAGVSEERRLVVFPVPKDG